MPPRSNKNNMRAGHTQRLPANKVQQYEAAADAAFFAQYGPNGPNPVIEWSISKQRTPAGERPLSQLTIAQGRLVAEVLMMDLIPIGKTALEIIDLIRSELATHPEKRRLVVQGDLFDLDVAPTSIALNTGDRGSIVVSNPEPVLPLVYWVTGRSAKYVVSPDHGIIAAGGSQRIEIRGVARRVKSTKLCVAFGLVDGSATNAKEAKERAVMLDARFVELRRA